MENKENETLEKKSMLGDLFNCVRRQENAIIILCRRKKSRFCG